MLLSHRTMYATLAATALSGLLAACGGGDGGVNDNVAGVTATSTSTPRYGDDLVITLQGRNLDRPITANGGFACGSLTLSSTAPYVSSATTAYYRCTGVGVGARQITFVRPSDSVVLASVAFTVPQPQVTLSISNGAGISGDVVLTLEAAKTPITVNNFLAYVKSGYYTDTVFHRLVPDFIIQGGGYARPLAPSGTLPVLKTTNAPIALEDNAGLSNVKYTVAMARTSAPDSATAQFFINLVDNPFLDRVSAVQRGYAVFATITGNTALVDAMLTAPCVSWPTFFAGDAPNACLPSPNLVVTAAAQTR